MNFFEDDFANINRNYFCKNCSVRINVYWEKFAKKQMSVINCEVCNQTTFALPKYCIYCGSRHSTGLREPVIDIDPAYKERREMELRTNLRPTYSSQTIIVNSTKRPDTTRTKKIILWVTCGCTLAGLIFFIFFIMEACKNLG